MKAARVTIAALAAAALLSSTAAAQPYPDQADPADRPRHSGRRDGRARAHHDAGAHRRSGLALRRGQSGRSERPHRHRARGEIARRRLYAARGQWHAERGGPERGAQPPLRYVAGLCRDQPHLYVRILPRRAPVAAGRNREGAGRTRPEQGRAKSFSAPSAISRARTSRASSSSSLPGSTSCTCRTRARPQPWSRS